MSRRITRSFKRKSINSNESNVLDPDTNVLGDEQTHWWKNLDEITFLPRSSLYDMKNETSRRLNSFSQLNSSDNASEKWWKNLDPSDSDRTSSISKQKNFSAEIAKANVLDMSTSESEVEGHVKKRKTRLQAVNRRSSGNAFLNALNNPVTTESLRSKLKEISASSDSSAIDTSPEKSHKNKDSSDTRLITTVLKSKTNIFDKKKGRKMTNDNVFQNVLTESDNLDNARKESVTVANESSIRQHIDEDERNNDSAGTVPLSSSLKLSISGEQTSVSKNDVIDSLQNSNKSEKRETNTIIKPKSRTSTNLRKSIEKNVPADIIENSTVNKSLENTDKSDETNIVAKPKFGLLSYLRKSIEKNVFTKVLEDNFSVNKTPQSANESADETNVIKKPKSRLLTRSQNSIEDNAFLDVLKNDNTASSAMHNLNKKTDIHEDKSQSLDKSLSSSPTESVNKSQNKADTIYENVTKKATRNSIRRKLKLPSLSEKHSSNISAQEDPNITEQNSMKLSSGNNSFHQLSPQVSLPYPQYLKHLRSKRRSSHENPFEEILQEVEIISSKENNTIMTNENIVKQNKTGNRISPSQRFSTTKEIVQLNKDRNISDQHSNDPLLLPNVSTSEIVQVADKNVSRNNTMPSLTKINETNQITRRNNSYNYTDNERGLTTPVKSKLNQSEKIHPIRVSPRKRSSNSETLKIANKHTTDLHRHSVQHNVEIEEENKNSNVNNAPQVKSSIRTPRNISTNKDTSSVSKDSSRNSVLSAKQLELEEVIVNNNIETLLTGKTVQQNVSLSKSKTTNMPSRHDLSQTSIIHTPSNSGLIIKENKKISSRQQSKNVPQNQHSTSISKAGLPKKITLDNFFKVKTHMSVDKQGPSNDRRFASSNIFGNTKITEQIRKEVQNMKKRELVTMKATVTTEKNQRLINAKNTELIKKLHGKKPAKVVDKAFLVNGTVYKAPRLPRPKFWVTNRLYKFLWKHMEPKYKLTTRVKSEKFIENLSKVVSFVQKSKHYKDYKLDLEALMKEMARLDIICNRNDFYHFCQDFMPYDFRIKAIPMILSGNKTNIPYNPKLLLTPLLNTE